MKKFLLNVALVAATCIAMGLTSCGKEDEPADYSNTQAVNLGLRVKWAPMNIGADSAEASGYCLAWGETQPKNKFDWTNYRYCNGDRLKLTKYNNISVCGEVDNLSTLEMSDDAARCYWGGRWRTPTPDEWTELREKCTWTWTTQNGIKGYLVTGKNGNSIFLPAAGYHDSEGIKSVNSAGYYWSCSIGGLFPTKATTAYFDEQNNQSSAAERCCGLYVRAVRP